MDAPVQALIMQSTSLSELAMGLFSRQADVLERCGRIVIHLLH